MCIILRQNYTRKDMAGFWIRNKWLQIRNNTPSELIIQLLTQNIYPLHMHEIAI